ncbi:hypothetical protein BDN72DRAFT_841981 [Pluteus cervinus]|uniref:Uncharacterized protein n=1 Tax=Pluteus cervinus TaxID=181527 RepID=A0ACD3ARF8_9AGAR|nr:hypothetical protein BDN72DRAFT_841981 [Pluteus cervinus]
MRCREQASKNMATTVCCPTPYASSSYHREVEEIPVKRGEVRVLICKDAARIAPVYLIALDH